jgi:hypothetical protein
VIDKLAERAPGAVGANFTLTVTVPFGGIEAGSVGPVIVKSLVLVPMNDSAVMFRFAVPVFLMVIGCAALLVLTF